MLLKPIYAENIIVAVICNKVWQWYVTEKDLWYLDYNKLEKAYLNKGFKIEDLIEDNERKGIEVLDDQAISIFLDRIKKYLTTKKELKNLLKKKIEEINESDDLLDLGPSILVNFDNKSFYSMFPEPASFEKYIPEGWNGEYLDFTNLIRDEEKYWLDEGNENMFQSFINKE